MIDDDIKLSFKLKDVLHKCKICGRKKCRSSNHSKLRWYNNEELIQHLLPLVYSRATHAFIKGCGKETMQYWFKEISGVYFSPKLIRKVLIKNLSMSINRLNYKCFTL